MSATILEPISPPLSSSSFSSSPSSTSSLPSTSTPPSQPVRYSRLPFLVAQCVAGPSTPGPQRHIFFAVRRGRNPGVYTDWREAERQVSEFVEPLCKTFSTKLAAEAFVKGWDGAGRHSLPPSSPLPLREYLALEFGASSLPPSSRSKTYHARLLATDLDFPSTVAPGISSSSTMSKLAPPVPSGSIGLGMGVAAASTVSGPSQFGLVAAAPTRPPLRPHSSSYRNSMVRISSPLRQQVDDSEDEETSNRSEEQESSRPPSSRRQSLSQQQMQSSVTVIPYQSAASPSQALAKLTAGLNSVAAVAKGGVRPNSIVGPGGMVTPPQSPESMMSRQRPLKSRATSESRPWASTSHRDFATSRGMSSPPKSPTTSASSAPLSSPPSTRERGRPFFRSPSSSSLASTTSGLWADSHAPPPSKKQSASSSLSSPSSSSLSSSVSSSSAPWKRVNGSTTDFTSGSGSSSDEPGGIPSELQLSPGKATPKFSRSSMKKTGVIMPVSAPKSPPPSLKSRLSQSSLSSLSKSNPALTRSPSSTSLSSVGSGSMVPYVKQSSLSTHSRSLRARGADRLASLAETSKANIHLDEDSLELSLAPPRPAFMRRTPSNSSLSSTASSQSVASYTSGSSVPLSIVDTITEEAAMVPHTLTSGEQRMAMLSASVMSNDDKVESMIEEEEDVDADNISEESQRISCTRSDGDADLEVGVETVSSSSASIRAGAMSGVQVGALVPMPQSKKKAGGGGMFKRFSKALKLEKKGSNDRRPSL